MDAIIPIWIGLSIPLGFLGTFILFDSDAFARDLGGEGRAVLVIGVCVIGGALWPLIAAGCVVWLLISAGRGFAQVFRFLFPKKPKAVELPRAEVRRR